MTTIYQLPGVGEESILLLHLWSGKTRNNFMALLRDRSPPVQRPHKSQRCWPKLALAILSGMDTEQADCFNRNDVNALVALPGVGKKTGNVVLRCVMKRDSGRPMCCRRKAQLPRPRW